MSADEELERLKARRLAEMQKNLAQKGEPAKQPEPEDGPREVLAKSLGYRGLEVLENAERQFPSQAGMVTAKLAEMIRSGEMPAPIDGGSLLELYRLIGMRVRMDSKIKVAQDGKLVSLSEKLREKE